MRPLITPAVDPELTEAFWRYDDALLTNDVATMSRLFDDSPHTMRIDGQRILVGHSEITRFRSSRQHRATRQIMTAQARSIAPDTVLIAATTHAPGRKGLRGYQTQIWQRRVHGWVIIAAHLTQPPSPENAGFDTAMWRCVGSPLVPRGRTGALDGIGVAVKDLFAVRGFAVGAGNPTWLADAPVEEQSADVVLALLDAGAHINGIAHTDEFAYSLDGMNQHYGAPPNSVQPGGIPGGSSSGSVSAVGAGQAQLGLGSDTAGSIRVPASVQGMIALRTTHQAVSTTGMLGLAPTFDSVGLAAARPDVLTAAVAALIPASESLRPPAETITVPALTSIAAPDVRRDFQRSLSRMVAEGILPPIGELHIEPSTLDTWMRAFRVVQGAEAWTQYGAWVEQHPHALSGPVAERFRFAASLTGDQICQARQHVIEARTYLTDVTDAALLALPTCPDGAPERTATAPFLNLFRTATLRLTTLASIAALPAISIPLLETSNGKPVGLSLLGRAGSDRYLTSLASRSLREAIE